MRPPHEAVQAPSSDNNESSQNAEASRYDQKLRQPRHLQSEHDKHGMEHEDLTESDTTSAPSVSSDEDDGDDVDVASSAGSIESGDEAGVVEDSRVSHQQQQEVPKWVRVGERVCFSTVVAAVLIPSSQDLNPAAKRELWWQPADYADFRLNYAAHMHDPSMEMREEQREEGNKTPAPAVVVESHLGPPTGKGDTATVEGVLVVAASPAPAPLSSRSVNKTAASCRTGDVTDAGWNPTGSGVVGRSAPAFRQDEQHAKSSRHERVGRYQSQRHQHRNVQGSRVRMGSKQGFSSPVSQLPPNVAPQVFNGVQAFHQNQQPSAGVRTHPGIVHGYARRDGRHDAYNVPPPRVAGRNDLGFHQYHHNYSVAGVGTVPSHFARQQSQQHYQHNQQQRFFRNSNSAAVHRGSPHQRHLQHAGMRCGSPDLPYRRDPTCNLPAAAAVKSFVPAQAHQSSVGSFRAGNVGPVRAAFPSPGGGGTGHLGGMCRRPASAPPTTGSTGGGSHLPVTVPVVNPSQFSMWRSQLVFAPVMHMQ